VAEAHLNGIWLYYEEHGEAAPIRCIHRGAGSALIWADAVRDAGAAGPRHRLSPPWLRKQRALGTLRAHHRRRAADDAAALLDASAATPAVVIGRSYGGAVAVDLALRYPGHVRALVLLEGDALGHGRGQPVIPSARGLRVDEGRPVEADGTPSTTPPGRDQVPRIAVEEEIKRSLAAEGLEVDEVDCGMSAMLHLDDSMRCEVTLPDGRKAAFQAEVDRTAGPDDLHVTLDAADQQPTSTAPQRFPSGEDTAVRARAEDAIEQEGTKIDSGRTGVYRSKRDPAWVVVIGTLADRGDPWHVWAALRRGPRHAHGRRCARDAAGGRAG
jgi:pimeloyl-ACP methyl ester carboxylesterase